MLYGFYFNVLMTVHSISLFKYYNIVCTSTKRFCFGVCTSACLFVCSHNNSVSYEDIILEIFMWVGSDQRVLCRNFGEGQDENLDTKYPRFQYPKVPFSMYFQ